MKVKKNTLSARTLLKKTASALRLCRLFLKAEPCLRAFFLLTKKNFIQSKFQKIFIDKSWQKAHTSMQKILQKSLHLQLYLKSNLEEKLWHKHNGTI